MGNHHRSLILITVAGFVFGADAARGEIIGQLRGLMGEDSAHAIKGLLESAHRPANSAIATTIGGALLVVGATTILKLCAALVVASSNLDHLNIKGRQDTIMACAENPCLPAAER